MNKKSLLRVISLLLAALMAAGSFGLFASADDDDYVPGTPEYCENVLGGHDYDNDGYCTECGMYNSDYDGSLTPDDYPPGTPEYCEYVLGGHVYGDDGFCVECGQQDPDYDGSLTPDDYEPGTPEYCENVLGGHVYGDDGFCVECGQPDPNFDPFTSYTIIPLETGKNEVFYDSCASPKVYYSFTAEEDGKYAFCSVSEGDPYLEIYDSDFNSYDSFDDERGYNFLAYLDLEEGDTYYFFAGDLSSEEMTFDFWVKPVTSALNIESNYISTYGDPVPDAGDTAYLLVDSSETDFTVTYYDEEGYQQETALTHLGYTQGELYSFTMPSSGDVTVTGSNTEKDYRVRVESVPDIRYYSPSHANAGETVTVTYEIENDEYSVVSPSISYEGEEGSVSIVPQNYSFNFDGKTYTGFSFTMPEKDVEIALGFSLDSLTVSGTVAEGENTLSVNKSETLYYSFTPEEDGEYYFISYANDGTPDTAAVLLDGDYQSMATADDTFSSNNESYGLFFYDFGISEALNAGETYYLALTTYDPGSHSVKVYCGRKTGDYLIYTNGSNGEVTTDTRSASTGDTVTITAVPDDGYVLSKLIVLCNKSTEIIELDPNSKPLEFEMPANNVIVKAYFERAEFTGASLSLGGEIGVNFYAAVPGSTDGVYVIFTVDGRRSTVKINPETSIEQNGTVMYPFTCKIGAAQTNSEITAVLYVGGKKADVFEYSVNRYIYECYDQYSDSQELINLVGALGQYGYTANKLFGLYTDFEIPVIDGYQDDYTTVTARTLGDTSDRVEDTNSHVNIEGVTLLLRSKTAMRLYFTLENDADLLEAIYSSDDLGINDTTAEVKETEKNGKAMYYIEVAEIPPALLGAEITFTITTLDGVIEVCYSPKDYIIRAISSVDNYNGEGECNYALADCCRALWLYGQYAYAYFTM